MPSSVACLRLASDVGTPVYFLPALTASPTASMKKRVVEPVPRPITPESGSSASAARAAARFASSMDAMPPYNLSAEPRVTGSGSLHASPTSAR